MTRHLNAGPEPDYEDDPVPKADETVRLRREIAGLEQEVEKYKAEAQQAKVAAKDATIAVNALRKILDPFHTAIRMLYGEIDRVSVEEFAETISRPGPSATNESKWKVWQTKLPPKEWAIIEAILSHGPMSRLQIAAAVHSHKDNVSSWCSNLKGKQLLTKNGDLWSLRENG